MIRQLLEKIRTQTELTIVQCSQKCGDIEIMDSIHSSYTCRSCSDKAIKMTKRLESLIELSYKKFDKKVIFCTSPGYKICGASKFVSLKSKRDDFVCKKCGDKK